MYLFQQNSNNVNQQWIEINRGNGFYSYRKQDTSHCLDGGANGAQGQNVYLWVCRDNNQNQHWQKINAGSGFVRLLKRNASGFVLDGANNNANFASIKLFDASSQNRNLEWRIDPVN